MTRSHWLLSSMVLPILLLLASGCGAPLAAPGPTQTPIPPSATWTMAPSSTATPVSALRPLPTPDLAQRPLVWFAPLPPLRVMEGRPFVGAEDFMDLFEPDAQWSRSADRVQVFKLYGEWVGTDPWNVHASDAELRQVVGDLAQRGIALAMEAGPLDATAACGQGIEGFGGGLSTGLRDARRIKASGGELVFVALDEPFAFASLYNGPGACRWTAEKVAQEVGDYIKGMRTVFPDLLVGDTEPLWKDVEVEAYKDWLATFREVNGYDLAFFHLDVDFGRMSWPEAALELETFTRERGIEFGIIYLGNWGSQTDEEWLTAAGERVKAYELIAGGQPDHVLFQSWHDHPDYTLPETEPYTFTWFVNAYFEDKGSLGVRTAGVGANVAYDKPVRASRSNQFPPGAAVDGDPDTAWGAGDFAPQWLEIDLEVPTAIAEVRLLVGQSPDGETTHRISVKGAEPGDAFQVAHTFSGVTVDAQRLTVAFPEPLEAIRYLRVETLSSPSWVAWREVEVISGE